MNLLSYSLFTLIKFFILIIPVLILVAYLTLAESKVLGYTQTSKGPNVVGMHGILQPLANSVKLFSKEMVMPNHVNIMLYLFSPMMTLSLSLIVWSLLPLGETSTMADMNLILLLMFAFSSISVYAMLISGWSSNSKYSFLGALSAAVQMISYEVCMGLMMINIMLCVGALNLNLILITQIQSIWFWIPLLPAGLMFFMSCLAETNSAPFNLTESESELVSGYNVECSSMSFALFFLAEYSHMMFMSFLITIIFWVVVVLFNSTLLFFVKASLMVFAFSWVSTSFPSLKYDQLMHWLWKTYLPLSLGMIMLTNSVFWFSNGLPVKLCI